MSSQHVLLVLPLPCCLARSPSSGSLSLVPGLWAGLADTLGRTQREVSAGPERAQGQELLELVVKGGNQKGTGPGGLAAGARRWPPGPAQGAPA